MVENVRWKNTLLSQICWRNVHKYCRWQVLAHQRFKLGTARKTHFLLPIILPGLSNFNLSRPTSFFEAAMNPQCAQPVLIPSQSPYKKPQSTHMFFFCTLGGRMCRQPDITNILRALQLDLLWTLHMRKALLDDADDCIHPIDVPVALRRRQISKVYPSHDPTKLHDAYLRRKHLRHQTGHGQADGPPQHEQSCP
ncbi:hypothetical protein ATG98_2177 [Marinobacter sp. LV10R520-4]|nr:hypothetical protein ATG98_2177 [Marinobacter sp. LV10R520-4]